MRRLLVIFILITYSHASFSQEEKPEVSPDIFVNHLGYLPAAPKVAFVSAVTAMPFELHRYQPESPQNAPVIKGILKLSQAHDASTGIHVWEADFSQINATGTYQLQVHGIGKSLPFKISPSVYGQTAVEALKSFYFHRSGVELTEKYAHEFSREALHTNDAVLFDLQQNEPVIHPASGGWYDGSNLGKHTVSGAYAAGILLQLHEMKPDLFPDGSVGIPGFRNGSPDIVDEARWELEWLMRMQRDDGGVHHKITAKEPLSKPDDQNKDTTRFVLPVSTNATANACAVLAKASRVYQRYDSQFAEACFKSSQKAWAFLINNPEPQPFENPEGFRTKSYSDEDDNDERIWAAVELFISTGEPKYYTAVQILTENRVPLLSSAGYWGQVMPLAAGSIVVHPTPFAETKVLEEMKADLLSLADTIVETANQSGMRSSLKPDDILWGSNHALLQNAAILILAHDSQPKQNYLATALDQLHIVLGRNPLSMSFVTGTGHTSPQTPFHFYHQITKPTKPVPGMLVAGPNGSLSDGIVKKAFTAQTPPALVYQDHAESFSTNETSITWNAIYTFVTAWFHADS